MTTFKSLATLLFWVAMLTIGWLLLVVGVAGVVVCPIRLLYHVFYFDDPLLAGGGWWVAYGLIIVMQLALAVGAAMAVTIGIAAVRISTGEVVERYDDLLIDW